MKEVIKIILSNWINLLTIFVVVYIVGVISAIIEDKFTFGEALFGTIYSIILYGLMFWIGFIACILILDIILFSFNRNSKYTAAKLLAEWTIIIAPFIYWVVRYGEWIFLVGILAFLLGQYLRKPLILRIQKR